MALSKIWTDHIKDPAKKEDFRKYVLNSRQLTTRLIEIIDLQLSKIDRAEQNEDYSSPSWAMLQADRIGQIKAYKSIKTLLDHGEK